MLDEQTYPDKNVIKFANQFVSLKIDMDRQGKIGQQFNVAGSPTIMFIEPTGKVIGYFAGFRTPKDFIDESMKILKTRKRK